MALGALIGAYQEDDSGGLRALLPLAGRTLVEFQARCAAAAGAAPIVVVVERIPQALQEAFERLRLDGISVVPVSDGNEAASRFEAGALILLIGDGVAPPADLLGQLAEEPEPAVATVPDDEHHQSYERIDASSRWAGVAVVDGRTLGSTVAMLGDWDLQSTLLRRAIQEGARRIPAGSGTGEPLLVERADQLAEFERGLIAASRGVRRDWASRYILPPVEELATAQLMETRLHPEWLVWAALALTTGAIFAFGHGWLWTGLGLLIVSTPLDLVAERLATLRLRPLPARMLTRRLLWPAAGLALAALGWWLWRSTGGWGTLVLAIGACAFAEADRLERNAGENPGQIWLFSRPNAILATIPFAIGGAWTATLIGLAIYASGSFFFTQHVRHRIGPS